MINRRTKGVAAIAIGLSLVAAACGSDNKTSEATTPPTEAPATTAATVTTEAPASTAPGTTEAGTATTAAESSAAETPAMTITYTLSDAAVWNDGTPMSAADFECSRQAVLGTPGSLSTTGYDLITSVSEGATPKEVVVELKQIYAPWRGLFSATPGLLEASQHSDCNDVSGDFGTGKYSYGAGPYVMTDWTAEQIVWEKNPDYKGKYTTGPDKVVIVPAEDGPTLLKAGTVDAIYPQGYTGLDQELADPNVASEAKPGGQFEALYFQQDDACTPDENRSCAFANDDYRKAFSESIDLDGVYQQIYAPFAQGLPLLTCGPIAPGPYCDDTLFTNTYNPADAEKTLTAAGWTKNADGMWADADGNVPQVHWMVNTGNTRRESTQEYLIPKMAEAGFDVKADNCESLPCVFQTRLPAEEYDMGMYISTVAPDPTYLTQVFVCDQVPSEANNFQGQNSSGWCNEEATKELYEADKTLDQAARADLVKSAIAKMKDDFVLLPTLQFPQVGAYRTDRVDGTQSNLANYWLFQDWWNFKDLDGDGTVVIGAEQFAAPDCTDPVTECANSSWFVWSAAFPNFPQMYWTTDDQQYVPSEYLAKEADVTTA